jgi:hypothetical protein
MKFKIRTVSNTVGPSLTRLQQNLGNLPNEYYAEYRKNTPKRSGNARDNTKLRNDTIEANYDYAQRLDQGYSRQSPKGMKEPTDDYIETLIDQFIRK